jgi:hypothetical protein
MTAARRRWKCARSTREVLRTGALVRQSLGEDLAHAHAGENCTSVSRPLSRIASRRRKRPTSTQCSENSTENQPDCLVGARPTKMDTGTSCTSCSGAGGARASRRDSASE